MRKHFVFFLILFSLLLAGCGEAQFGMSGDEFLTRLVSVFYRVRGGFNSNSISLAEKTPEGTTMSYNNSIFLTVHETRERSDVESISVVLVTQDASPARQFLKGGVPGDDMLFENICLQVIFALNPRMSDVNGQRILREIGGDSLFLDGKRRSASDGKYRYIMKLHENGMAIMVVTSTQ
ncbi:hypothetical protein LJC40_01285 [Synergistaceae bacterium OttesenSCG-928-D05]|nr:hypothetical protein [Synergistaceae bacterium OttesenSCG-928-D05]